MAGNRSLQGASGRSIHHQRDLAGGFFVPQTSHLRLLLAFWKVQAIQAHCLDLGAGAASWLAFTFSLPSLTDSSGLSFFLGGCILKRASRSLSGLENVDAGVGRATVLGGSAMPSSSLRPGELFELLAVDGLDPP